MSFVSNFDPRMSQYKFSPKMYLQFVNLVHKITNKRHWRMCFNFYNGSVSHIYEQK